MKRPALLVLVSALLLFSACSTRDLPTAPPENRLFRTTIDLSRFVNPNDSARFAYSDQMAVKDGKAYVLVQRLNGWTADSSGLVVVVNTSADTIERVIRLRHGNPSSLAISGSRLLVTTSGGYVTGDGALEIAALTDSVSVDLIPEAGFDPACAAFYQIQVRNDTLAFVSAYLGWKNAPVYAVNTLTGTVIRKLSGIVDAFGGLAYAPVGDRLYVGEVDSVGQGILVYDGATLNQVGARIPTILPPASLTFHTVAGAAYVLLSLSDYKSGKIQVLNCGVPSILSWDIPVWQDCVIRSVNGRALALERGSASNLLEFNLSGMVLRQIHLGNSVNPVDIDYDETGEYYISLQNSSGIAVWKE